ncbi:MAG: hypothetical protein JNJ54_01735 [Myxococcaceae bacterium]|nr:hypothetical protein [Myxococcaceae bacterium]
MLIVEKGTPGFAVSKRLKKLGWRISDTRFAAHLRHGCDAVDDTLRLDALLDGRVAGALLEPDSKLRESGRDSVDLRPRGLLVIGRTHDASYRRAGRAGRVHAAHAVSS